MATAATQPKLDKAVFGIEVKNHDLLRAAYEAYLANGRSNLAKTKTRGQVRGSTIKPWRQKGTGRARFGSRYNPIWRGGGIVFGPSGQENYSKGLNTKAKRLAVKQALSLKAGEKKVSVVAKIESKTGKTAELVKLLPTNARTTLLIVDKKTPELTRAAKNIPRVSVVSARYVNVYDVLNADQIIFSQDALIITTQWLTSAAASKSVDTKEVK